MSLLIRNKFLLLLTFIAIAHLLNFHFRNVPMISDEGGYAYAAKFWSSNYRLYQDILIDRPQGIFLIYKFIFLFTQSTSGIRVFSTLSQSLCAYLIFYISKSITTPRKALLSALIFQIFIVSPRIEGFSANAEIFTMPMILISTILSKKHKWFWTSITAALAFIIKPIGLSSLLFGILWSTYIYFPDKKIILKTYLTITVAFILGITPFIAHMFYSTSTNKYLWIFIDKAKTDSIFSFNYLFFTKFIHSAILTISAWITPLILSFVALKNISKPNQLFLLLFFFTSLIGMSIGGNWFLHYYTQIIPTLSILCGLGITIIYQNLVNNKNITKNLLFLTIIVATLIDLSRFYFMTPYQISWNLYHRPSYILHEPISQYISQNSSPNDTLFIAFSDAQLYYSNNRMAATTYLYWTNFTNSSQIQEEVATTLKHQKPTLIIETLDPTTKSNYPNIAKNWNDNYQFDKSISVEITDYSNNISITQPQITTHSCQDNISHTNNQYHICANTYKRI